MNISINAYNKHEFGYKPYEYMLRAGWCDLSIAYQDREFPYLTGSGWEDYISSIRYELDSRGMRCVQTHMPYYDLRRDCRDCDEKTDILLERGLVLAARLGAKWCAFHCRTAIEPGGHNDDIAYRENYFLLKRLLRVAREYGVGIAVENLPYFEYFPLFAADYRDVIRLVDELDDPQHVGICWDFGHAHKNGVDQAVALREVGSRLKATHIHNNFGHDDQHLPVPLGTVDWDVMMRALADIGYDGSLSLELLYPQDERFAESYFAAARSSAACLLEIFDSAKKEQT